MGNRNNGDGPKFQLKPPSGRRHSSTGNFQHNMNMKMLEQLPPRLRKKFLQEKGLAVDDGGWDGNSSVYQVDWRLGLNATSVAIDFLP